MKQEAHIEAQEQTWKLKAKHLYINNVKAKVDDEHPTPLFPIAVELASN